MRTYVIRRLLLLPVTVILLSIFAFGLVRLVPGSVVDARLSNTMGASAGGSPEQRAALEAHFGLDKPVHVQYVNWVGQVFTGDFGDSWLTRESISETFARRMPVTAELLFLTLLLYIPIGIGTGVWSAVRRNRPDDYGIRFITVLFLAIPNFWLATLVVLIPLVLWHYALPAPYAQLWDDPGTNLLQMIVPAAGGGAVGRGRAGTAGALGDAGSAAPGLRAHRPGQGRLRPRRGPAPRAAQRHDPPDHPDRARLRRRRRGVGDRRADLRAAGHGPPARRLHLRERPAGRAALDAVLRHGPSSSSTWPWTSATPSSIPGSGSSERRRAGCGRLR